MIPAGPLPIAPLSSPPDLIWRVPGSKSITNRALVLAALADGESTLEGVLHSDDTRHMRSALEALGIGIEDAGPHTLVVKGGRSRLRAPGRELFVGNSGTTVRFLAALACLVPGEVVLVGDEHMAKRPIADLVDGLRQLGADVACATGCPPLRIRGGGLKGGALTMRGDRSSQYFSAVMMAGPLAESAIDLRVAGELVSRPYVEITRRMVADFGGRIDEAAGGFTVHPAAGYRPRAYPIEPDASSASYPFALAAAAGGAVTVPGLAEGALQGDYRFVELLEQAGARVSRQGDATTVRGDGRLRGIDVDMHHISDTVMTLAAIAPLLEGPTTIRNVANIRIKETDRLAATVAELRRLGQEVTHGDDWLRIEPRPLTPALVRSYSDHRMAMSFAILGLCRPGITIEDPACVAKTYPTFWEDVERCRSADRAAAPRG
ncbi:3-phosphoshikimate 1-carboxyvinyltransferase [Sorangium sp. So ce1000]|uniref:3-phosphoshikimate 1-carboxyvinyltransferase n=1 Tax=Sorangium sp. So ce1000 TaxID=3133325 RepID=UPI003F5E1F7E